MGDKRDRDFGRLVRACGSKVGGSHAILAILDHLVLEFELIDQVAEVEWVHVLGKQIEKEPVTDATIAQHVPNRFLVGNATMRVSGNDTHAWVENSERTVH